ncbi:uncharacterized protein N7484_000860 [Penicillium longicatenatum]|uniref:uncharacterized protein n=1 Tax=Penicillium longicatenatum TaxID=1561947 RepID=UPI0025482D1B|nr:uncharacterized protein N7484_000860 [Penicillium longicatenatum]KAJ5657211.1 hypothetical protein N7484_000860 [Penicillium longicatenatum]
MLRLGWLLVILSARCAWGDFLPIDERCVTAIYSAYNYISFAGEPATGMWDTRCQNPLKVTSIYAASEIYCRDVDRAAGLAQLASECEEFGHRELLPREAVAENLNEDVIRNLRTVSYLEMSWDEVADEPIMISASFFNRMHNTIDSWQFETWSHHAFGYIGYAYWGVLILLGMCYRLCRWAIHHRKPRMQRGVESQTYPLLNRWRAIPLVGHTIHWLQTHLIVSAPLASRGREMLLCTFSNRAEALAVGGFWILSIVLSLVGYRTFEGNIYWADVTSQILRYAADRTGIMAFANLPLLWLFGGRNNILIWATGWSFATYNIFHRHVARVATFQALAHAAFYLVIYFRANKMWKVFYKTYILWGIIAVLVMFFLLLTSLDRLRFSSYEIFLIIHIVLSGFTLVGCFYHTTIFEGHEYWQYLWPSVGIWAFDRFLRMVRLCYCNMHVGITGGNLIRTSSSQMTYDEETDVVRLEVSLATPLIHPTPGDYFFLYQPFRWTGWESHPFTVGAWSSHLRSMSSSSKMLRKSSESLSVSQMPLLPSGSQGREDLMPTEEPSTGSNIPRLKAIFWIRPYDGWTRHLRQQCLRAKSQPVNTTILLEGPYGHHFSLWKYESVLIIVGGTGIASAVPYLQDHLRRSGHDWEEGSEEKTRIRDIELIWTAKQVPFLKDVASRELKPLLLREDFQASFYTTGSSTISSEDVTDLGYEITPGRPHLQSLIMSRACDASSAEISLAVLACGPVGMADEARAAAHLAMRQGYRIKYVEESFAW